MSLVGSSKSITGGAAMSAAASSSLRAMPAESVPSVASREDESPSFAMMSAAAGRSQRVPGYSETMKSSSSPARIHGMAGGALGASTTWAASWSSAWPSRRIAPDNSGSEPAMASSSEVLPMPLGPVMTCTPGANSELSALRLPRGNFTASRVREALMSWRRG